MKAMTKMAEMSTLLAQQSTKAVENSKEAASITLKEEKSKYSEHMIAALCGYCRVMDPSKIPDLWREFEKHTSPVSWRADIAVAMQEWADANKVVLERNLYYTDQWLKDLIKGLFNPGGARASLATAEKGISPLPCRPRSATEVESLIVFQQATTESEAQRSLQDALKISSSDTAPRSPPNDYHDLCTMLGTFAALLFALFGMGCEFFAAVFHLYNTLISDRVVDIKGCFTPLYCKQITWAVIEEGRTFFGTQLHPRVLATDFVGAIRWPSSLLSKVCDDVIFGLPVTRQTFPLAWAELKQAAVPHPPLMLPPNPPNPFSSALKKPPQPQPLPPGAYAHMNARLRQLFKPLHDKLGGRIPMKKSLSLNGMDFPDLPKLERCIQGGKNKLCYQHICGICPRGEKCYMKLEAGGHPPPGDLDCTDPATGRHFVDHLWDVCKNGVDYIVRHGDDLNRKPVVTANNQPNNESPAGGKRKRN